MPKKLVRPRTAKQPNELRLKIEMVPGPLWGMNLRSDFGLGRYRWDKLRKALIAERGPACVYCGAAENPHGHEIWEYKVARGIGTAVLTGIEIVCRMCHHVHHFGRSLRLMGEGIMDPDEVMAVRLGQTALHSGERMQSPRFRCPCTRKF